MKRITNSLGMDLFFHEYDIVLNAESVLNENDYSGAVTILNNSLAAMEMQTELSVKTRMVSKCGREINFCCGRLRFSLV